MTQNLAQNLLITAAQHPERAALCFQVSAITYAELDSLTARVAGKPPTTA